MPEYQNNWWNNKQNANNFVANMKYARSTQHDTRHTQKTCSHSSFDATRIYHQIWFIVKLTRSYCVFMISVWFGIKLNFICLQNLQILLYIECIYDISMYTNGVNICMHCKQTKICKKNRTKLNYTRNSAKNLLMRPTYLLLQLAITSWPRKFHIGEQVKVWNKSWSAVFVDEVKL